MLAPQHRMRTSVQFSQTTRSGARSGRRNVVVYALPSPEDQPTRTGFIVSKAVGNAVVRNLVKRRLRELTAQTVRETPRGLQLVVRALPDAAEAGWPQLAADYAGALKTVRRKLDAGREGRA